MIICDIQSSNNIQAAIIDNFLTENLLQINPEKCELVIDLRGSIPENTQVKVGSTDLKPSTASKCLGVWWTPDLYVLQKPLPKTQRLKRHFSLLDAFTGP